MEVNLLYRHPLNMSRDSYWVPIRLQKESNLGYRRLARSLMIDWESYDGPGDAAITIYTTNHPRANVRGRTIIINTSSNRSDAYMQYIGGQYQYIRVEYDRGSGNPSGNISATLYYD